MDEEISGGVRQVRRVPEFDSVADGVAAADIRLGEHDACSAPEHIERLIERLGDPDGGNGAETLQEIGSPAVEPVCRALGDGNSLARRMSQTWRTPSPASRRSFGTGTLQE